MSGPWKIGDLVRFNDQRNGGPVHRVVAIGFDRMIRLHDMGGWFAPHLFTAADDIGGIPPDVPRVPDPRDALIDKLEAASRAMLAHADDFVLVCGEDLFHPTRVALHEALAVVQAWRDGEHRAMPRTEGDGDE